MVAETGVAEVVYLIDPHSLATAAAKILAGPEPYRAVCHQVWQRCNWVESRRHLDVYDRLAVASRVGRTG